MDSPKNEQNALDYLEVGIQNGDWLFLTECEKASSNVMREIGVQLYTLAPDPKNFSRRELFRLWLVVEKPIDINDRGNPIFPAVLTQHALLVWHERSQNKNKVICKQPADPALVELQCQRKLARKQRGQDSDDESDDELNDPAKRVTGMWFHRAVDFYTAESDNLISQSFDDIFDAIERNDINAVKSILRRQTVDLNTTTKAGLTPLLWAIMCDNVHIVRLLLENEADPNVRRQTNDMPPIFMPIEEPEMLQVLLDYGADIDARYEGKTLLEHPDTAPQLKSFLKKYMS
jgi:hypothetical protein